MPHVSKVDFTCKMSWTSVPAFLSTHLCLIQSWQHLPDDGCTGPVPLSSLPIPRVLGTGDQEQSFFSCGRQWVLAGIQAAASSVSSVHTKGSSSALLFLQL